MMFGSELQTGNDPIWRSSAVTPIQSPHLTVLTAGCRHVAFVISAETQSASRGQLPRGRGVVPPLASPPLPLPHAEPAGKTATCPNTCNYFRIRR